MRQAILLLSLICLGCVSANLPAANVAITQSAVNKIKDAFLDYTVARVKEIPLPPLRYDNVEFRHMGICDPGLRHDDTEANLESGYVNF